MGSRRKIVTVVGARPQFIKAAPVTRALKAGSAVDEVMLHTGQHFDRNMSEVFFDELSIPPPHYNLDIHGGPQGEMTGRMLIAIERVLLDEAPDGILIYGDTNSTAAGALAAAKLHIPVFHVEAGLRSFNRRMPEEINRIVADHLSAVLFCPTRTAVLNLEREGITRGVHHVGDVMYDAALATLERAKAQSRILDDLGLAPKAFALATLHRAENTDDPIALAKALAWLKGRAKERPVVFPVHPRTRQAAARAGLDLNGLVAIDPVGPLDITQLTANAAEVYTDSGGLQKEAYFHRVPCVTLRSETEWVETVAHGWNRLWTEPAYRPRSDITDYGRGDSAALIADIVAQALAAG